MNQWNYISRICGNDEWQVAKDMDLNYCDLEWVECPSFDSEEDLYGTWNNVSWSLPEGSQCNVTINATAALGRVIFEDTDYLGIEFEDRRPNDVITVEGAVTDVRVFNAAETGPITFRIAFSGASSLALSAIAATALAVLSF